jgi:uncharacterized protein YndB with AHSA1/START domain
MTLRDRVQIKTPPERVWSFVEDPERMKLWNPKIRKVTPISWGDRDRGFRYRITYVMGKKENEFSAEIVEYRKPERLVIRLSEGRLPWGGYVNEVYELSGTRDGTLLEQRIEINVEINIFLRWLIAFIVRFGSPTGKKYLQRLKELAEAPS